MHRNKLLNLLEVYGRNYPEESATVRRFEEFVRNHERCFERDCWAGHVTGSAWLVNQSHRHVLLTHHRKLDKWLQLGGHSDGDSDLAKIARRRFRDEMKLIIADRSLYPELIIVGWRHMINTDGAAVDYSLEACKQFITALPHDKFQHVRRHAERVSNFRPGPALSAAARKKLSGNSDSASLGS